MSPASDPTPEAPAAKWDIDPTDPAALEILELRPQLEALGVVEVSMSYSGSGDEGYSEGVTAEAQVPGMPAGTLEVITLPDTLVERCEALLEERLDEELHAYYDGLGGFGTIVWQLAHDRFDIDHNWNVESSEPDPRILTIPPLAVLVDAHPSEAYPGSSEDDV